MEDEKNALHKSGEDYLEAIFLLSKSKGVVRSVDVAEHFGYSKPSVSHAVSLLKKGGYLTAEDPGYLHLTESGQKIAEDMYERHCFFRTQLMEAGVEYEIADEEACSMEHTVSRDSFEKLRAHEKEKNADSDYFFAS